MGKTQIIGQDAEDLACRYLQEQGLSLIVRNFRCRVGEIDLIMQDKKSIVFVEVRCRKNNNYGGSLQSITYSKQTKLVRTANYFLQQQKLFEKVPARFDVIAITSSAVNSSIEWIKNAIC